MSLIEVKIPPMGESISSGVLAKWHVNDGDTVLRIVIPTRQPKRDPLMRRMFWATVSQVAWTGCSRSSGCWSTISKCGQAEATSMAL